MTTLWYYREFLVALLLLCGLAYAAYLLWPRPLPESEPEEGLDPGSLADLHHGFVPRVVYPLGQPEELRERGERVCGFVLRGADYSGALDGTDHCDEPESRHSAPMYSDPGSLAVTLRCDDQFTPAIRRAKEEA